MEYTDHMPDYPVTHTDGYAYCIFVDSKRGHLDVESLHSDVSYMMTMVS
jgi:hypothetical protein